MTICTIDFSFLVRATGTLRPAANDLIPTVTDNAFSRGIITSDLLGISFEPTTAVEALNGEITWGTPFCFDQLVF